jgi:hypothetical protein
MTDPRDRPALLVVFVVKVPASRHAAFRDWATRFDRYKAGLGIESEHFVTLPLPPGVSDGWRGLENAVGTSEGEETWVIIERFATREQRTRYLETREEPERVRYFEELHRLASDGEQVMNEQYPEGWEGFR